MIEAKTTAEEIMMKDIRRLKKSKCTNHDSLRRLRIMGYTIDQLLPTQKFSVRDFKLAGHTCRELFDAGVSPQLLVEQARFHAKHLKADLGLDAGTLLKVHKIKPIKLKTVKYTLNEQLQGGATFKDMKHIGYTAGDLRFEAGCTFQQVK